MKLIHFSDTYLTHVDSVKQPRPNTKPAGLWVSVEDPGSYGWRKWCRDSDFRTHRLSHRTEVVLKDNVRILHLSDPFQILDFTKEYEAPILDEKGKPIELTLSGLYIDWPRVAEKYQGIIISPYAWDLRLDSRVNWFYTWDCASGCLWDAKAVDKLVQVPKRAYRKKEVAK